MNGQMGVAIFFALLSRFSGNHWYEDFADELLENVCNNLSNQMPIDFANGLCGIGWGIEFLKHRGFIKDDTDEILSEIDTAIMGRDIRRIKDLSLESGLKGICAYVNSRIGSKWASGYIKSFDSIYLADLTNAAKNANIDMNITNIEDISEEWHSLLKTKGPNSWQEGICILEK